MTAAGILFDLDGTLVDTLDDIADSTNEMLAHYGAPPHTPETYKTTMVGMGAAELVRRALPEALRDPETCAEALGLFRANYGRNWNRKSQPYPGIPELLRAVAARGIPMAVISNKPDDFTKLVVRELLAEHSFGEVLGERPGVPRKPDPTSALELAATLGVEPGHCYLVGDSNVDMQTARAAGMHPVGVLWGFRRESELREHGAELLLSHPSELLPSIA
jgi:phosphoglycolate phosphatase